MTDKQLSGWGTGLLVTGILASVVGFFMVACGNPEAAGTFVGAAEKASRPRRRVTRRYYGIFGPYTETEYI